MWIQPCIWLQQDVYFDLWSSAPRDSSLMLTRCREVWKLGSTLGTAINPLVNSNCHLTSLGLPEKPWRLLKHSFSNLLKEFWTLLSIFTCFVVLSLPVQHGNKTKCGRNFGPGRTKQNGDNSHSCNSWWCCWKPSWCASLQLRPLERLASVKQY